MNQVILHLKQAVPIGSGLGGVYVGIPWIVVVLGLLFFYGVPYANGWIAVARNLRAAPGSPDRLTAQDALGRTARNRLTDAVPSPVEPRALAAQTPPSLARASSAPGAAADAPASAPSRRGVDAA